MSRRNFRIGDRQRSAEGLRIEVIVWRHRFGHLDVTVKID